MQEKPVSWFTAVRSGAITCRKMQHIRPTKKNITETHAINSKYWQKENNMKKYETYAN